MSHVILDSSSSNFSAWRVSIFEHVSSLKYCDYAISLSSTTPIRERPYVDTVTIPKPQLTQS